MKAGTLNISYIWDFTVLEKTYLKRCICYFGTVYRRYNKTLYNKNRKLLTNIVFPLVRYIVGVKCGISNIWMICSQLSDQPHVDVMVYAAILAPFHYDEH